MRSYHTRAIAVYLRRGRIARTATVALLALALGALLAACGGVGAAGSSGAAGGASATARAGATKTTLTPGATPAATATSPVSGAKVASCPGGAIASAAPNPTRVVTPADRLHTISVQVGAVVEVRLPTVAQRWSFDGKDAPTLTPLAAQGNVVASLHACVWDFTAAQAGTVTLGFVGQPICADRQPCPQYAMLLPLTVSVA